MSIKIEIKIEYLMNMRIKMRMNIIIKVGMVDIKFDLN